MYKKLAIPTDHNGFLDSHFGQAEMFSIFDITDPLNIKELKIVPPPHSPGALPLWLAKLAIEAVICGNIGERARSVSKENNIEVFAGADPKFAKDLIQEYINGDLVLTEHKCSHDHGHPHDGDCKH
ncbi:MAG: ATPase [Bacteroidales bacterium]|nr:ATPase [Bacteroidales bacterium]